jgi:dipeptidyl aminopeptidase/acylaminoacyl peptidase
MKSHALGAAAFLACASLFAAETAGPALAQGQARLLRHPTYHQGRVAFSYLSDIWTAQENGSDVRRLTDHQARDVFPRFSPDGSRIAFSSGRDGNLDVFVVAIGGGKPRQLTFHSADDTVLGWSPDGRTILFTSSRNKGVYPGILTLFAVSPDGSNSFYTWCDDIACASLNYVSPACGAAGALPAPTASSSMRDMNSGSSSRAREMPGQAGSRSWSRRP